MLPRVAAGVTEPPPPPEPLPAAELAFTMDSSTYLISTTEAAIPSFSRWQVDRLGGTAPLDFKVWELLKEGDQKSG
jgi:hypothetical protein